MRIEWLSVSGLAAESTGCGYSTAWTYLTVVRMGSM